MWISCELSIYTFWDESRKMHYFSLFSLLDNSIISIIIVILILLILYILLFMSICDNIDK